MNFYFPVFVLWSRNLTLRAYIKNKKTFVIILAWQPRGHTCLISDSFSKFIPSKQITGPYHLKIRCAWVKYHLTNAPFILPLTDVRACAQPAFAFDAPLLWVARPSWRKAISAVILDPVFTTLMHFIWAGAVSSAARVLVLYPANMRKGCSDLRPPTSFLHARDEAFRVYGRARQGILAC